MTSESADSQHTGAVSSFLKHNRMGTVLPYFVGLDAEEKYPKRTLYVQSMLNVQIQEPESLGDHLEPSRQSPSSARRDWDVNDHGAWFPMAL